MNKALLHKKFTHSLQWNAIFYFANKAFITILTFLLFYREKSAIFSLWANTNSFIFIFSLWFDCGLRKSIPRYCVEFKKKGLLQQFFMVIFIIKAAIFLILIPFFFITAKIFFQTLALPYTQKILFTATALFLIEGSNNCIKQFYHAHFWNKWHTIISTGGLCIESIISSLIIFLFHGKEMVFYLLLLQVIMRTLITITSFIILRIKTAHFDNELQEAKGKNTYILYHKFIRHSLMMWFSNTIKSLTERNVLLPFLTMILGVAQGNLYKMINDMVLLFHRPYIKIIGSSDTLLFTHLAEYKNKEKRLTISCVKLSTQIARCCIPLFVFVVLLSFGKFFMGKSDFYVISIFLIILSARFIETIVSPYERLLEVMQSYRLLITAYTPYIGMILILFSFPIVSLIGLFLTLVLIHFVRLVSLFLIVLFSREAFLEKSKNNLSPLLSSLKGW